METICFDADFTLVKYHLRNFIKLNYEKILSNLVELNYSEELFEHFALEEPEKYFVSGLIADMQTGYLLKLSKGNFILKAFYGFEEVAPEVLERIYGSPPKFQVKEVVPYYQENHCWLFLTNFSLGTGLVFRVGVERIRQGILSKSFSELATDIKKAIQMNFDNSNEGFFAKVRKNPEDYIVSQPELRQLLERLSETGKKLVLVTNSPVSYTELIMEFTLGSNWMDLFDTVLASAQKPQFFKESSAEVMKGEKNHLDWSQVVFVGDHYVGDVYAAKMSYAKVGCVFEEAQRELGVQGVLSKALKSQSGGEYHDQWGSVIGAEGEGFWWEWVCRYSDFISTDVEGIINYLIAN